MSWQTKNDATVHSFLLRAEHASEKHNSTVKSMIQLWLSEKWKRDSNARKDWNRFLHGLLCATEWIAANDNGRACNLNSRSDRRRPGNEDCGEVGREDLTFWSRPFDRDRQRVHGLPNRGDCAMQERNRPVQLQQSVNEVISENERITETPRCSNIHDSTHQCSRDHWRKSSSTIIVYGSAPRIKRRPLSWLESPRRWIRPPNKDS
jgi:hypothetical protein